MSKLAKPRPEDDSVKSLLQIGVALIVTVAALTAGAFLFLPQIPSVFFAPLSQSLELAGTYWKEDFAPEKVRLGVGDLTFNKGGNIHFAGSIDRENTSNVPIWRWKQEGNTVFVEPLIRGKASFTGRLLYGGPRPDGRPGRGDSLVGTWSVGDRRYAAAYRFGNLL